jgi:uroporphyrinogen decarboxylase
MVSTAPQHLTGEQRMLAAARREPVDCTPVWFMRQAGRCLEGYRKLRERYDILTLTRTPELCAQVTMMPVDELSVDAAVLYADIMLPLIGMGVPFTIDPGVGPIIEHPVRTAQDIAALRIVAAEEATPELFDAIRIVRSRLAGRAAVIGFAGAPFTVASYMIEGRPTRDFSRSKELIYAHPALWHQLMETLTEVTIRYLRGQVAAGAELLQLFDSWAGALSRPAYIEHVLPYTTRIFAAIADSDVPSIHFATNASHILEAIASAGSDVVSVDWRLPLGEAWSRIGAGQGIQGNLDPAIALAPFDVVNTHATQILREAGGRAGHIFNLGHGVLAETPAGNLRRLVDMVHSETARR